MSYEFDSPCNEDWEAMKPRGRGRFCESCQHVVIDASRMTEKEVDAHYRESDGKFCARMLTNPVGDPIFRREPPPRRGLGSFVLLSALTSAACGSEAPERPPVEVVPAMPVEVAPAAAAESGQAMVEAPVATVDSPQAAGTAATPAADENEADEDCSDEVLPADSVVRHTMGGARRRGAGQRRPTGVDHTF